MRLVFTKMHGLGNDFIVFDAAGPEQVPDGATLRRLADRHTGIGFDQALALSPPRGTDCAVYYRIYNADGGEVEQCGNGARCVAALVARRLGQSSGTLQMECAAGRVAARIAEDGRVSVALATPRFAPAALPFVAEAEAPQYELDVGGQIMQIGAVSVGNPHAVIRVASVADAPVDSLGPLVENHPRFPHRTNVGFMQIISRSQLRLRVHERGVGETRACGTGALAAVAVGRRNDWLDENVDVELPGGHLGVEWPDSAGPIWLAGPTATVFEGTAEL
jgi:diaminopimelate epimerase